MTWSSPVAAIRGRPPERSPLAPRILVLCDHYLPGFRAGGPIRTLSTLVQQLGREFTFCVITRDHDFGEAHSFPEVESDTWYVVGKANVKYVGRRERSWWRLLRRVRAVPYDVLYINSLFSLHFGIKPLMLRRLRLLRRTPVVLAPRGELAPDALALGRTKKYLYLLVAEKVGFYRDITWQASSVYEQADIVRRFGEGVRVSVAPNLSPVDNVPPAERLESKRGGEVRIVFLSRIAPMKNLVTALELLRELNGRVELDIYGPREDPSYWRECERMIQLMPSNVSAKYCGAVEHEHVASTLAKYDLLLLPTLGENFGHVILEALHSGRPVLISDRTPWRGLEAAGCGWDFPLDRPSQFREALQACIDMDAHDWEKASRAARAMALAHSRDTTALAASRALLQEASAAQARRSQKSRVAL